MPGRVHVVAPSGRDTAVIVETLTRAGIEAAGSSPATLIEALTDASAGAVVMTDEALARVDLKLLAETIDAQPPWSDYPIILLTREGATLPPSVSDILQNVTLLQRPLHGTALVSVTTAALRARKRQWKARDYLREREIAEERIRHLADTLELRVAERTQELTRAMAERILADMQRQESENLYRTTIELSGLIPWTSRADGQIQSAGDGWYHMTGATIEETISAGWRGFIHADDVEDATAKWTHSITTLTRFDTEYRVRQRDGTYRQCRAQGAPRVDPETGSVRWYGTLEDIHDRFLAEEELRQVQSELIHVSRLSAMGAMAATLAHELNQPLSAIANYVRGAQRLLSGGGLDHLETVKDALTEADAGAIRAGEVVRKLRELVARGAVERHAEDLATLIYEAARIALVDAGALGITCSFELDEEIIVLGDRVQLQQVIINLLRNAVEAVQGGPRRQVVVVAEPIDTQYCRVGVHDSGPGVPDDFAARLFTPFATTKVHGVGIGLSISRTIVEANGGQLTLEPSRLGGAAFCFTIPLSASAD